MFSGSLALQQHGRIDLLVSFRTRSTSSSDIILAVRLLHDPTTRIPVDEEYKEISKNSSSPPSVGLYLPAEMGDSKAIPTRPSVSSWMPHSFWDRHWDFQICLGLNFISHDNLSFNHEAPERICNVLDSSSDTARYHKKIRRQWMAVPLVLKLME